MRSTRRATVLNPQPIFDLTLGDVRSNGFCPLFSSTPLDQSRADINELQISPINVTPPQPPNVSAAAAPIATAPSPASTPSSTISSFLTPIITSATRGRKRKSNAPPSTTASTNPTQQESPAAPVEMIPNNNNVNQINASTSNEPVFKQPRHARSRRVCGSSIVNPPLTSTPIANQISAPTTSLPSTTTPTVAAQAVIATPRQEPTTSSAMILLNTSSSRRKQPNPHRNDNNNSKNINSAPAVVNQTIKKKTKAKKSKAEKEIRKYQKSTDLLLRKLPFANIVRCITIRLVNEPESIIPHVGAYRWQSIAIACLQEATEMFLVKLFENSYLLSLHAKRVTLTKRDFQLMQRLQENPF